MKGKYAIGILIAIVLMDALAGMEFDLFVPSFAELQASFHISAFWTEALLSVNFIGYFVSLFVTGTLADHYGRKKIILLGLFVFIVGSVCCITAPWYPILLLGRFLQGIGIAAPAILSFLIIADKYPIKQQQVLMAMLNGSLNISAAAAPVIGSYITLYFHWRGNFVALLGLGLLTCIVTMLFVEKDRPKNKVSTLSFMSYIHVLKCKPVLLMIFYIVVMATPYWIFVGISPLLYMKSLHITLHTFGYYQGVLAFIFAIGSVVLGFIVSKYAQNKWLLLGLCLFIASLLAMLYASFIGNNSALVITGAMLLFVIAQIIPSVVIYPLCLNYLPEDKAKVAALQQGSRLIFVSIVLQITGYFYHGSFTLTGSIIAAFILVVILTQIILMKKPYLQEAK